MNLEFVCFFVAFEASEAAKFEDGQLAYLDILYLVQTLLKTSVSSDGSVNGYPENAA